MKTKILILTILAALSLGCVETGVVGLKQRAIRRWGPEENWTQQQRWAFLVTAQQLMRDEHELEVARASRPVYQPVYQPIIPYTDPYIMSGAQPYSGGTTTVTPINPGNPSAGANVWGAHRGQIIPNGNGGWTYWGN